MKENWIATVIEEFLPLQNKIEVATEMKYINETQMTFFYFLVRHGASGNYTALLIFSLAGTAKLIFS